MKQELKYLEHLACLGGVCLLNASKKCSKLGLKALNKTVVVPLVSVLQKTKDLKKERAAARELGLEYYYIDDYDTKIDFIVNELIDKGKLIKIERYNAVFQLGENIVSVWTSNKYYSYGSVEGLGRGLPKVSTRLKLRNYLEGTNAKKI